MLICGTEMEKLTLKPNFHSIATGLVCEYIGLVSREFRYHSIIVQRVHKLTI